MDGLGLGLGLGFFLEPLPLSITTTSLSLSWGGCRSSYRCMREDVSGSLKIYFGQWPSSVEQKHVQYGSARSVICVKEVVGGSRCWEVDRVEKGGRGAITQKLYIETYVNINQ